MKGHGDNTCLNFSKIKGRWLVIVALIGNALNRDPERAIISAGEEPL